MRRESIAIAKSSILLRSEVSTLGLGLAILDKALSNDLGSGDLIGLCGMGNLSEQLIGQLDPDCRLRKNRITVLRSSQ